MKIKYAFYEARQIDSSLNGDVWPKGLTISQIANLHFSENKNKKRAFFNLLEDSLSSGGFDFEDIAARYNWSCGVLSDMVGGSNAKEMTSSHCPENGWSEFWSGLKPGDVKKLSGHVCGCEAKCTLEKIFDNGLPKRWDVKSIHEDGLRIEFTCWGLPLISAKQYKKFCSDNGVVNPNESYLNSWIHAEQTLLLKDKKQIENAEIRGADRDRISQLHCLIWRVYLHLLSNGGKSTAQQVWNEIQFRHKFHDKEEIIQEANTNLIEWCSGYGNEQTLKRSSFDKTLSSLKKNPPF